MNDWIETSVDENGDFRVGGVLPGDYRLLVESSGHAPLLTDNITVAGDDDVTAGPLKLARAHRLKIACTPARRCGSVAELLLGDGNDDWAALRAPLADGKGDLLPAPEGEHRLRLLDHSAVVAEKSVTIAPDAESQEVTISIPETEVRGTVTRGGRPAAGGSVQFVGHATSQAIPAFFRIWPISAVVVDLQLVPVMPTKREFGWARASSSMSQKIGLPAARAAAAMACGCGK